MSMIIVAGNINEAFRDGFIWLRENGVRENSRNGPVLVARGLVVTEYQYPRERVLFNARRDANHAFHLMEALWMLAGHNDVSFLLPFNSRYSDYAEPDGRQHGAYGHRWTKHFMVPQISMIINMLREDPESRRAVLNMWDPRVDLGANKRDVPCNTSAYFDLRGGTLNMTVQCRSNDILWGAYGANVVHFSILQELIALALGKPLGVYRQVSNNFHAYTDLPMVQSFLDTPPECVDPYLGGITEPMPLISGQERWEHFVRDCINLVNPENDYAYQTQFFRLVARPMYRAYMHRKNKLEYQSIVDGMPSDNDWTVGFKEWLGRRDK